MSDRRGDETIIRARALTKDYKAGEIVVRALRGVDLDVKKGEFLALVGPSGCGKSTLLHLLGGLTTPTSGELVVASVDLVNASERQLLRFRRDRVGFVFQRFNLLPSMTVLGNLQIAGRIRGNGHRTTHEAKRVLEMLGLSDKAARRPSQISQGEQQRVAIARAVLNEPSLILADEPTGNLDSENTEVILKELRRLNEMLDVTVVLATHNPVVSAKADRVVRLRDGGIVEESA